MDTECLVTPGALQKQKRQLWPSVENLINRLKCLLLAGLYVGRLPFSLSGLTLTLMLLSFENPNHHLFKECQSSRARLKEHLKKTLNMRDLQTPPLT